ncbi:MAG TPA: ribonuclease P protein component [Candidatus Sulfotelmatobacter sp.]
MTNISIGNLDQAIRVSGSAPQDDSKREPGKKVGFPRSGRLLRHADFERVYKLGRRHFSATITVFYLPRTVGVAGSSPVRSGPRVGFTVGRALGGAVVRNRMKRRLREAVRLARTGAVGDVDVVMNPKKGLLAAEFEAVVNEVRRAFVVIEKKVGGGAGSTER